MPKFISPKELYENPKLFFSIPSELMPMIDALMAKLYPDWKERLKKEAENWVYIPKKDGSAIVMPFRTPEEKAAAFAEYFKDDTDHAESA